MVRINRHGPATNVTFSSLARGAVLQHSVSASASACSQGIMHKPGGFVRGQACKIQNMITAMIIRHLFNDACGASRRPACDVALPRDLTSLRWVTVFSEVFRLSMAHARSMAQHEAILAAWRRAEPAVAAGADPYKATNLVFRPAKCIGDAYTACVAECPHILAALIENYGVDVNRVAEGDWVTLLIASALHGSTKCNAVLLSHGADVNLAAVSETGLASPLLAAAQKGACRRLSTASRGRSRVGVPRRTVSVHCPSFRCPRRQSWSVCTSYAARS